MRWLPIRWRLTLFYTITMLVVVLGLILAMYAVIGDQQTSQLRERVSDCARATASMATDTGALDVNALDSVGCSGVSIAMLDGNGRVLDEIGSAIGPGRVFPGDLWQKALESGQPSQAHQFRLPSAGDETRYAYAIPLPAGGGAARVAVASLTYASMGAETVFIIPTVIAGVAILALIVITTASYFLVRSSLAPVKAITTTAQQISGSDLSRRLPVENPRDELGQLSITINDLLARLEIAFRQREQTLADQRRFVADASHELRTPLTSILGYTRMLKSWGLEHPDAAKEGVAALEQEANRMHGLVQSLLRLARGEEFSALSMVPLDIRAILASAGESARALTAGRREIVVQIPEEPVLVMADRAMMLQAIEVLLDNAITYAGSPEPIEVVVREEEGCAVIRVTDHGPGIDPEHLPHLFERFYRAEASRTTRGSGLGLAIAKQIVEQHAGTVDVTSVVGTGTTFTITLPLIAPAPHP